MQGVWLSKNDYEVRMRKLLAEIHGTLTTWSQTDFSTIPTSPTPTETPSSSSNVAPTTSSGPLRMYYALKDHSADFAAYKQSKKREWVLEKSDLAMLIGNVQTKLKTYGLREYVPPAGLSIAVSTLALHLEVCDLDVQLLRTWTWNGTTCWQPRLSGSEPSTLKLESE